MQTHGTSWDIRQNRQWLPGDSFIIFQGRSCAGRIGVNEVRRRERDGGHLFTWASENSTAVVAGSNRSATGSRQIKATGMGIQEGRQGESMKKEAREQVVEMMETMKQQERESEVAGRWRPGEN